MVHSDVRQPKSPAWSPDSKALVINMQQGGTLEPSCFCTTWFSWRPGPCPRDPPLDSNGREAACFEDLGRAGWGLRLIDLPTGEWQDQKRDFVSFTPTWDPINALAHRLQRRRHGRHLHRRLPRARSPAADDRRRHGGRLPGQGLPDRHAHGGRGRRLHRLARRGRQPPGRAAQRGRHAGARPPTASAAPSPRSPTPTWCSGRIGTRRRLGGSIAHRSRAGAPRPSRAWPRAWIGRSASRRSPRAS